MQRMRDIRLLFLIAALVLSMTVVASGQAAADDIFKQVRKIKLLESKRDEVRHILYNFTPGDDDRHQQEFSNDEADITVYYATGTCSDDRGEDDDPYPNGGQDKDIWQVSEWTVTKVEIRYQEPLEIDRLGFEISKLKKEQQYANEADSFLFHDRSLGLAIEIDEDGIQSIKLIPSNRDKKKLCNQAVSVKDFYSRKSWFDSPLEERQLGCPNLHADVVDLKLDIIEISATTGQKINVITVAVDPENDVLTYSYNVSGGHVSGRGAKVVWELIGLKPGTYTITAAVDDGAGPIGKKVTKSVLVK